MRSTLLSRRTAVLYAGVALFVALAAFTARVDLDRVARAIRRGARRRRVFDLVGQRMPLAADRSAGRDGVAAAASSNGTRAHLDADRARALPAASRPAADRVPGRAATRCARCDAADVVGGRCRRACALRRSGAVADAGVAAPSTPRRVRRRERSSSRVGARWTPIAAASAHASRSRPCAAVVPALRARAGRHRARHRAQPLPAVPGDRPPQPVRVYTVAEDGTLVSAPWRRRRRSDRPAPSTAGAARCSARGPGLPTFAPEEFFFASIRARIRVERDAAGGATPASISISAAADWSRRSLRPIVAPRRAARRHRARPRVRHRLARIRRRRRRAGRRRRRPVRRPGRASWSSFDAALARTAPAPLRAAVAELAVARSAEPRGHADPSPLRHGLVERSARSPRFRCRMRPGC